MWTKKLLLSIAVIALDVAGFAQPAPPAAPAPPRARSVIARPLAKRGYLGVGVLDLTNDRAKALKLPDDAGVEIMRVQQNSAAAKAGLKESDVILEVNGQKIVDVDQFVGLIADQDTNAKMNMVIWRDGKKENVTATLDSRPANFFSFVQPMPVPSPPEPPDWNALVFPGQAPRVGFEGESLTPQLAEFFGVKEGVLVRTVSENTPAAKAGLKAGDVVIKVSGTPVSTTREISGIIRAIHRNVTFTIVRNHKEITVNVEIAATREPRSLEREVL